MNILKIELLNITMDWGEYILGIDSLIDKKISGIKKMVFNEKNRVGTQLYKNLHNLLPGLSIYKKRSDNYRSPIANAFEQYKKDNLLNDLLPSSKFNIFIEEYIKDRIIITDNIDERHIKINEYYNNILSVEDISFQLIQEFIDNMEKLKKLIHEDKSIISLFIKESKIKLRKLVNELHIESHYENLAVILKLS
jgi:hypothetical protein